METADILNLLTHVKDKIGITIENSDGSFIIAGSLAQINECQQILLQRFHMQETIWSGMRNPSFDASSQGGGTEIVKSAANSGSDTRPVLASKPNKENVEQHEENRRSRKPEVVTPPGPNAQWSGVINPDITHTFTQIIDTDRLVLRFVRKIYGGRLESIRDRHCVRPVANTDDTKLTLQPLKGCDAAQYSAAVNEVFQLLRTASQGMTTWTSPDIEDNSEQCSSMLLNRIQTKWPVVIERIPETRSFVVYGDAASVKIVEEMFREGKSQRNGQPDWNGHGFPSRVQHVTQRTVEPSTALYEFHTKNDVSVSLRYGDITEERVDAIVNPANEYLSHGAGLASLIVRKGGDDIKRDSEILIHRHNYIPVGKVVHTRSGYLPCKYVIHAVGPEWGKQSDEMSRSLLKKATFGSLLLASRLGLKSLALPAISSGVFRFPLADCAAAMMTAVEEYLGLAQKGNQKANHSTKENDEINAQMEGVPTASHDPSEESSKCGICDIRFVFIDADAMDVFGKECIKRFGVEGKRTNHQVSYV